MELTLIHKAVAFQNLSAKNDAGTFDGYGSTWSLDSYGDKIARGAFARTIREKSGKVPILVNHSMDTWAGTTVSLVENEKGLRVEGQLFLDTAAGRDVFGLLKNAAAAAAPVGLSIGFIAKDTDIQDGVRVIKQVDLWEISVCAFPANAGAQVHDVRSVRELERELRNRGISRALSRTALSGEFRPEFESTLRRLLKNRRRSSVLSEWHP